MVLNRYPKTNSFALNWAMSYSPMNFNAINLGERFWTYLQKKKIEVLGMVLFKG